jgi:hypothetical protein
VSGDALGIEIDMDRVVDPEFVGDVGIEHSTELLAFTNLVHRGGPALDGARQALITSVGADGLVEAAATIAAFNGLVRVADGTGIQLDAGLDGFSHDERARLGIDEFAGAANTDAVTPADETVDSIAGLFG